MRLGSGYRSMVTGGMGKLANLNQPEVNMGDNSDADERLQQTLIDVAIESWRFSKMFAKVLAKLDAGEASRYVGQLRYFQKKLEENLSGNGLVLVNVEGQRYDPGMAAATLNLEDFSPDDILVVDQMIEPIVMDQNGLRKQGTIMLKKVSL